MISALVRTLDNQLMLTLPHPRLNRLPRGFIEFLYFGFKEARACLFVVLFFTAIFVIPRNGVLGIPRYDALLIIALAIQAWMLGRKLETWDEFKTICVFHLMGFALEAFKVSAGIRSWSYPDFAYTKIFDVPLFSGFMYAAIGSYIMQAWRLLDVRIERHPPYWMTGILSFAMYANFYTHHWIGDFRWYLAAIALGLYARCIIVFRPLDRERTMPALVAFILIGFFIWLAENVATFFSVWRYPNQIDAWAAVHIGKWSSWSLLVMLTFSIVTNLKHIKERIQLAQ